MPLHQFFSQSNMFLGLKVGCFLFCLFGCIDILVFVIYEERIKELEKLFLILAKINSKNYCQFMCILN